MLYDVAGRTDEGCGGSSVRSLRLRRHVDARQQARAVQCGRSGLPLGVRLRYRRAAAISRLTTGQMLSFGSASQRRYDGRLHAGLADGADGRLGGGGRLQLARKLTTVNPQAADFAIGETEVITWKSSDGWHVEGVLVKPVGYQAGPAVSAARGRPRRPDRRAHQRLQDRCPQRRAALGRAGLGGAVPEPARQQQLRREVHARQHSRLGRRRLPRHHGGRRRSHQARHRRSGQARGDGLELRRLHDVLDRLADDALQGGADGRRSVQHHQHVRDDRHPRLHRHVLRQQSRRRSNLEALPERSGAHLRRPSDDAAAHHARHERRAGADRTADGVLPRAEGPRQDRGAGVVSARRPRLHRVLPSARSDPARARVDDEVRARRRHNHDRRSSRRGGWGRRRAAESPPIWRAPRRWSTRGRTRALRD